MTKKFQTTPATMKHSIVIFGKKTSISLEYEFWVALNCMANEVELPLCRMLENIDRARSGKGNLSSAIRLAVLKYTRGHKIQY